MATYVIREKNFGYSDEVYYVTGHRIAKVFTEQTQAEIAYKQLEIVAARNLPLHDIAFFFDAKDKEIQALDEFVFSRCGEHIVKNGRILEDVLPTALSPDDTFEFIQRAKMQTYQLIAFEQEAQFYSLWLLNQQDWVKQYDEYFTGLVYEASIDQLKHYADRIFDDYDGLDIILEGALEDLTDQPILLQSVIAANKGLSYKEKTQELKIQAWNTKALFSIHPLLKKPLFEIRTLSVEEVQQIEQELQEEFGFDE